ncbi:MAG: hypothetical protein M1835_001828 [Candelina submexicana]|nr:MAG: hypothetical protein M1835_001828 [Candelina submexicana]
MATPTPSSKQTTGPSNTMTPGSFANHLATAFSPLPTGTSGPRSVPSPAHLSGAHQSKAGKSPFNPTGLHSSPIATSNPPSNPSINFDSPNAAVALGLNLGSIGSLDGSLAGGSIVGAGHPRSDEERKEKLENILNILRTKPGRISEEGVERIAKRTGLEYHLDEIGGRTLSIAGSAVLVDVGFKSNVVEHVALTLPTSSDAVNAHAPKGAAILQEDLTAPPGVSSINTTLAKFGDNLERLARLDKLSTAELSCYEAISGVYASLQKIFEHEKDATKRSLGAASCEANWRAEREVLCKKSGRPMMHAGRRVGLSLQYWMDRRLVSAVGNMPPSVDVDNTTSGSEKSAYSDRAKSQLWSMTIECEASPAELYPPIRVSESWVSEKISKSQAEDDLFGAPENNVTDWLEPSNTVMPVASGQGDAMAIDSATNTHKLPDIRFIARLEPPIVVPLQTAIEIYATVGISIPPESFRPTTFDGLVLPPDASEGPVQQGATRELKRQRVVVAYQENGDAVERRHTNTVYAQKQDFGRVIDEIPFSHPKQLVAILASLRQFALVGSILNHSLPIDHTSISQSNSPFPDPLINPNKSTLDEELAALLSDTPPIPSQPIDPLPIDITLNTQPIPRISLTFPLNDQVAYLTLEISHNADIAIVEQNILTIKPNEASGAAGKRKRLTAENLKRALEITEDIGLFVEYLRQRLA